MVEGIFERLMGCSQVVRHGTLNPTSVGSIPTTPAKFKPKGNQQSIKLQDYGKSKYFYFSPL